MLLKIIQLDTNKELTSFSEGTHAIGRGDTLQCNDKRVSRNHALIKVTPSEATLTSNHLNPCFLKASEGTSVTVLSKDTSKLLSNGDKFAFLPDAFWFKVRIEEVVNSEQNSDRVASKRALDDAGDREREKRQKPEDLLETIAFEESTAYGEACALEIEVDEDITPDELDLEVVLPAEVPEEPGQVKEEVNAEPEEINEEPTSTNEEPKEDKEEPKEAKEEPKETKKEPKETKKEPKQAPSTSDPSGTANANNPGPSAKKQRRERCWYAATCYRQNPLHRSDFSHPGDSDFESDPSDDRPFCSYGAACYRRNKDHRREYRHPSGKPAAKNRRRKRKAAAAQPGPVDDDEDDYDLEDPFINDGSSDEYVEESDSSDTDWDDSQKYEEESEELRTLKKEAKKFVNNK